jgi:uridine kinase
MNRSPGPVTIGVAGGTASGKTTVSAAILERVGEEHIAYLKHDSYYKELADIPHPPGEPINFDHPDSLETPLLIRHIQQLKQWQAAEVPIYDFTTNARTGEYQLIQSQPIILVEGILIFSEPELRKLFDVRIFVDTDADIRFIRRLKRDTTERARTVESVIEQYLNSVRPMHLDFVEPSKRYADVIIPEGGKNLVAIEMVAARIRSMLENPDHRSLSSAR